MAAPSVTWTFTNGTTSDASQVNTNFTDVINCMTDGTKDFALGTLSVAGAVTFNGNVTLGNASADDITITGSLAGSVPVKANATYNVGGSTTGLLSVYLGNGSFTTRLLAGTNTASYTFTFPPASPTLPGKALFFDGNGVGEFRYHDKFTASKTADYTATGDETIIPCAPASSMTVTLPAASTMTGKSLTIIKTDSDVSKTVTIDGNSSETINGTVTYVLYTQNESVTIKCDGSNWYVEQHFASTPWVSAGTNTITGTTSNPTKGATPTKDDILWRRVGDSAHIRMYLQQANVGVVGSGDYLLGVPSTIGTIDTAKCAAYATVEGWSGQVVSAYAVGTAVYGISTQNIFGCVVVYDTSKVRLFGTSSIDLGAAGSAMPSLANATSMLMADFVVPMTGWNP